MYLKFVIIYRKCSSVIDVLVEIGSQIFIDCDLSKVSIMDLPVILNLNRKLILRFAFNSGTSNTKVFGHYYSVCHRNGGHGKHIITCKNKSDNNKNKRVPLHKCNNL